MAFIKNMILLRCFLLSVFLLVGCGGLCKASRHNSGRDGWVGAPSEKRINGLVVGLLNEGEVLNENYYIDEIADLRKHKDDIGIARLGFFNKRKPIYLEGGVEKSILKYYRQLLPKEEGKKPLTIKIHYLCLTEHMGWGQSAQAKAILEFIESSKTDGKGVFIKVLESKRSGFDVSKYHEENLNKLLRHGLSYYADHLKGSLSSNILDEDFVERELNIAEKEIKEIKSKSYEFYMGLMTNYQSLGGQFDGSAFLADETEALVLPNADPGIGYGVSLGWRMKSDLSYSLSWEFAFSTADLDSEWMGIPFDMTYQELSVNMSILFNNPKPTNPYLKASLGLPSLKVKNGAVKGYETTNARFNGWSYGIGGGISHCFGNRLVLKGELMYQGLIFRTAQGFQDKAGEITDPITTSNVVPGISLNYHF